MIASRVRELGPQHRGMRILYGRLAGVLVDVEPHPTWTGIVLAETPDFRWLIPTRDEIAITRGLP